MFEVTTNAIPFSCNGASILKHQVHKARLAAKWRGAEVEIHDGARVYGRAALVAVSSLHTVHELTGRRVRVQAHVKAKW